MLENLYVPKHTVYIKTMGYFKAEYYWIKCTVYICFD